MRAPALAAALLALALPAPAQTPTAGSSFYLHTGDRVLFYGDSITDQRLYTAITEAFIDTRYPALSISFSNAGWGGDRVSGGGGGPIDTRLTRDVLPFHPSVLTVMLGMNDGNYRPATAANDQTFYAGYRHIVDTVRAALPAVRITALLPSPYDDVTRTYSANGLDRFEYNEVLRGFGAWITTYAPTAHLDTADLNTDLVADLREAALNDPEAAKTIIPDRIHPSFAGHMLMAEALLKAWHARPMVSSVTLGASTHGTATITQATDAQVSALSGDGSTAAPLRWTEVDDALPLPFAQWSEMWGAGPVALVLKSSDLAEALNQQTLRIAHLRPGTYALAVDDTPVASFSASQLAAGVNLALLKTPSTDQAMRVYHLVTSKEELHYDWWRNIQVPLADQALPQSDAAIGSLKALEAALDTKIHAESQPTPHHFQVTLVQ